MPLETASIPLGYFMLGQRRKEAALRPVFLVRAFGNGRPALLERGQAKIIEDERETRGVDGLVHVAASTGLPSRTSYPLSGARWTTTPGSAAGSGEKRARNAAMSGTRWASRSLASTVARSASQPRS